MQKFEIHKTFVIATLISVATHLLLFEWTHIAHHATKQRIEPRLLQIHLTPPPLALRPSSNPPSPPEESPPEESPPEESPPEESPPEESPPEESPPEESPPEESPPAIFYKASELDVIPYAIEQIDLAYPKVDPPSFLGGQVTLLLRIDEYGKVEDVEVIEATPPKVFDEAARAGFLHRQFQAGIKSGWPVKSQIRIEVLFPPQLEIDH